MPQDALISYVRNYLLIAALFLTPLQVAIAHQDTIFEISKTGSLLRVPDKYQPASLQIKTEGKLTVVTVRVSGVSLELPPCLSRLFEIPANEKIRASGSWYHSRSHMPPYLSFELRQNTKPGDSALYGGHELIFDLESAALIEVYKWKLVGDGAQGSRVNLSDICTEAERKSLKPRPAA